jgi:transposase-like protein
MSEIKTRAKYPLEFKMEAVRLVKGGQSVSATSEVLGISKTSLFNWVKRSDLGELNGTGAIPANPDQLLLARLRAQLTRVTMERDMLKITTAYFARESM